VTAVTVESVTAVDPRPVLDDDSRAWLHDLRADGQAREAALARLHALLLRAARFEAARRRATLTQLRPGELDEIAAEAADDALVSILARLDDFRGASRFTTWAYKFALLETAVKLRKRAWQGREIPLDDEGWRGFAAGTLGPSGAAEQNELMEVVQLQIDQINRTMANHGFIVRLTDEARRWLVNKTCADRSYGARPLRRALQKYVEDPLSEALIQGNLGEASLVEMFVDGDELNFRSITIDEAGEEQINDLLLTQ